MLLRTGREHAEEKKIKGKGLSVRPYSVKEECVNGIELLCSILFVDIQML